jgi:serine protease SohB
MHGDWALEFLTEYGLFLAKVLTFLFAFGIAVGIAGSLGARTKKTHKGHLEVTSISDEYREMTDSFKSVVLDKHRFKLQLKKEKEDKKAAKKAEKQALKSSKNQDNPQEAHKPRLFVVDFHGDIRAAAVDNLREEITGILSLADKQDRVLLRLESAGGVVHGYGLAASQLVRIRDAGIPLTVAVDKVAASGGYMMACIADHIIAAPFAILGSIGVLAQLPNFHRLLQKHDVDYELFTAGEYKRTLTLFGENTDKGREKFLQELEDTHTLFKEFVTDQRPKVEIDKVATGEVWFGRRAQDIQLVDALQTSDQYLVDQLEAFDAYHVSYVQKRSLQEKLGLAMEGSLDRLMLKWLGRLSKPEWFS